jgi:hypothetical protein
MRYLQYHEPDEHDNIKIIRVTIDEAIQFMHQYSSRNDFVYQNDDEALDDFIAVNWAYWVEE